MQMRPDIQIQSMIKSMTDVVLPAIDSDNKLAQEQAQITVAMLQLMQKQLPLAFRYDRDELARLQTLGEELAEHARGGDRTETAAETLEASSEHALGVLDRARAEPTELQDAIKLLRADVGTLIQTLFQEGDPNSRALARSMVLNATADQLLRERAWLIEQGWEPDPEAIPPIKELLSNPNAKRA